MQIPPFTSDPRLLLGIGPSTTASSNALAHARKTNGQQSPDGALPHEITKGNLACKLTFLAF